MSLQASSIPSARRRRVESARRRLFRSAWLCIFFHFVLLQSVVLAFLVGERTLATRMSELGIWTGWLLLPGLCGDWLPWRVLPVPSISRDRARVLHLLQLTALTFPGGVYCAGNYGETTISHTFIGSGPALVLAAYLVPLLVPYAWQLGKVEGKAGLALAWGTTGGTALGLWVGGWLGCPVVVQLRGMLALVFVLPLAFWVISRVSHWWRPGGGQSASEP